MVENDDFKCECSKCVDGGIEVPNYLTEEEMQHWFETGELPNDYYSRLKN